MFLVGPLRQIKLMFELKRIVATLIYLGAMAMTLFSALYVNIFFLFIKQQKKISF